MKIFDLLSICLYPRRCKFCGDMVEFDREYCDNCDGKIKFIDDPICLFCGHSKSDCICNEKKFYYKAIIAPFYYENCAKHAINNFKFNKMTFLSSEMAENMKLCFEKHYSDIDFDCITSVPLHNKKLRKRGYNQSQLLAKDLSSKLNLEYKSLLKKVIDNDLQHNESAKNRKMNVYGAYEILNNVEVEGKTILLVDDIKTTGATLNECSKMLLLGGAKEIYAISYSITKRKKLTDL